MLSLIVKDVDLPARLEVAEEASWRHWKALQAAPSGYAVEDGAGFFHGSDFLAVQRRPSYQSAGCGASAEESQASAGADAAKGTGIGVWR